MRFLDSSVTTFPTSMQDAGETIFVSRTALTHVEQAVMARVRPAKFRRLFQVGDFGVPPWALKTERDVIKQYAKWAPVEHGQLPDDTVFSEVDISTDSQRLLAMITGYAYSDLELVRAQKSGVSLQTARASACMTAGETTLDAIAAKGSTTTEGGLASAQGIYGIYNIPNVTVHSSGFAGATTHYNDMLAAATDETDFQTLFRTIKNDLIALEVAIADGTAKETSAPDTLLLPSNLKGVMKSSGNARTDRSLESLLLESFEYVKRIEYWKRGDGAGASNKDRIVMYPSLDPEVVRFLLPQSPVPSTPVQVFGGVQIPVTLVTGGIQCGMPEGVGYLDLATESV